MPTGIYIRTEEQKQKERQRCLDWNKEKKGKSLKMEHKEKVIKSLNHQKGEFNNNWKGDQVGYGGLHDWVRDNLGTPSLCAHCGKTKGSFEWANVSGEYKRDLSDWIRLCIPCHDIFDDVGKLISAGIKKSNFIKLKRKEDIENVRISRFS